MNLTRNPSHLSDTALYATDEIPFNAMSCSSLIEISKLQEESREFSIQVEAVTDGHSLWNNQSQIHNK